MASRMRSSRPQTPSLSTSDLSPIATQLISQHVRLAGKHHRTELPSESVHDQELNGSSGDQKKERKRLRSNPRRACNHSVETALVDDHELSQQSSNLTIRISEQTETVPLQSDRNARKQLQSSKPRASGRRTRPAGPKYRCYAPGCKRTATRQRGNLITHFKEGAHTGIPWNVKLVREPTWSDDEEDASPDVMPEGLPDTSSTIQTSAGSRSFAPATPNFPESSTSSVVPTLRASAKKKPRGSPSSHPPTGPRWRCYVRGCKRVAKQRWDLRQHIKAGTHPGVTWDVKLVTHHELRDSDSLTHESVIGNTAVAEATPAAGISKARPDILMLEADPTGDPPTSDRASEMSWFSWDQPGIPANQNLNLENAPIPVNNCDRASMSYTAETIYPQTQRQVPYTGAWSISPRTQPFADLSNAGMAADFPANNVDHEQDVQAGTFRRLSSRSPTRPTSRVESESSSPSLPERGIIGSDQQQKTLERQGALIGVLDEENVRLRDRCHDLMAKFVLVGDKVTELRQLLRELEERLGSAVDE